MMSQTSRKALAAPLDFCFGKIIHFHSNFSKTPSTKSSLFPMALKILEYFCLYKGNADDERLT